VTVLVADDNAVNLKVACAMLGKLGYDVVTATDGRETVEVFAQVTARGEHFGAILMDVNMPDVDGLQATRQIQSAWGDRRPPSSPSPPRASAEDRERCEAAGMVDYLTKPLMVAALARCWRSGFPRVAGRARRRAPRRPGHGAAGASWTSPGCRSFATYDDEELTMTREVIGLVFARAPLRLDAMGRRHRLGRPGEACRRPPMRLKGSARQRAAPSAIQQRPPELEERWRLDQIPRTRTRCLRNAALPLGADRGCRSTPGAALP
jgi:CheY-like chemotaxis protein